jgi:hypothetical protein
LLKQQEGKKMTLKQICKAAGFASINEMAAVSGIPANYLHRLWQADEQQVTKIVAVYAPYRPCGDMGATLVFMEFSVDKSTITVSCKRRDMVRVLSKNGMDRQQIVAILMAGHEHDFGYYAEQMPASVDGFDDVAAMMARA